MGSEEDDDLVVRGGRDLINSQDLMLKGSSGELDDLEDSFCSLKVSSAEEIR